MVSSIRSAGLASVVAATLLVAGAAPPANAQPSAKRIVFLAGPRDHGAPGRHEYEKDLRALAWAVDHSPNLANVTTSVHVGRLSRDLTEVKGAAVIVIESSSDRAANETHPLFPPDPSTDHHGYDAETAAYLKALDGMIKSGVGVVVLHYATWVENWAARGMYIDWTGGLWVQMMSKNPNDQWTMTPRSVSHPVLRGVKPWTYRDEVFSRFFLPDDPKRTDLLIGTPAKSPIGPQVVAWAYQRGDGGRAFVFGGVDYHENMQLEDYRRFILNGIVWAAGMDVPDGGVQSSAPRDQ